MVSTATGHLKFSVTDLEISGSTPLMFQRAYNSGNDKDVGLGVGWSFVFDDRISLGSKTAQLLTGTGSVISFRRDAQSQHFVLKTDEPNAHQSFEVADENTIVEQSALWTRIYKKQEASYRLSQITDLNGNTISISFNAQGNVSQIASSSGATLTLEWSSGKNVKLLAVTDNSNRQVSFKQDGRRLRAVMDSAGAEWIYDYQGKGLTRALDPLNRVLLRARYDQEGSVVEAGDSAGTSLYDYEFGAAGVSHRTVITDPDGAKSVFEHTERGALTAISDDEGQTARIEYNAANRPARISSSFGDEATFSYDARNRITRQSANSGAETTYTYEDNGLISSIASGGARTGYEYDKRGNVTAVKRNDPNSSYRVIRDGQGRLLSLRMENGREATAEYDAVGNETASTYSDIGRFETDYDTAGRVIAKRFPSGSSHRYEYDARGKLAKRSDDKGHATKFERDASGMIIGIVAANRGWIRATRDETGRIVALSTSKGQSRRFAYNAKGALTEYTDEHGKRRTLKYDRRGRLRTITENTGKRTELERDKRGQVIRIFGLGQAGA